MVGASPRWVGANQPSGKPRFSVGSGQALFLPINQPASLISTCFRRQTHEVLNCFSDATTSRMMESGRRMPLSRETISNQTYFFG